MTQRTRPADYLCLVALAACWGLAFVFIRVAVPEFGVFALVEARTLLSCLLLLSCLYLAGMALDWRRNWPRYLISGAVGSALPFVLIAQAQTVQSASYSVVLVSMAPLMSALVAAIWIGERFTFAKGGGLLLGLAGVAVLTGWDPGRNDVPPAWAIGLTLAAAASYALAGVFAKRHAGDISPLAMATGSQLGAAVLLLAPAMAALPDRVPSLTVWANVAALAVFSSALAFLLYFRLIASIGPVKTLSVNYLTPLFGVGGGVFLLGEKFTPNVLAGTLAIFAGLSLVMLAGSARR